MVKLSTTTFLFALSASSAAAAEKDLRALNDNKKDSRVCYFYEFEGLWEGVDPTTGAIHNTEFSCERDSTGTMPWGNYCNIRTVVDKHWACEYTKTILEGRMNMDQFYAGEYCYTNDHVFLKVICPAGIDYGYEMNAWYTQDKKTYRIEAEVWLSKPEMYAVLEEDPAYKVTLNKIAGGWSTY